MADKKIDIVILEARVYPEELSIVLKKINTAQAAIKIGVPKRTLLGWITKGKFLTPFRDFSGYYWWDENELNEYIKQRGFTNEC